jgi:hypothetical protein
MKRLYFFASKADILLATDMLESKEEVKYILAHHNLHPNRGLNAPIYESAREIPDLGVAAAKQTGSCEHYLIAGRSQEVTPVSRLVGKNLPDGGRFITAYEAGACSHCVEFNAGGYWDGEVLINGLVQTWSLDPAAQKLMRIFSAGFKKAFPKKIGVYWIGPEALQFLTKGGRLTLNVNAAPSFDIRFTE